MSGPEAPRLKPDSEEFEDALDKLEFYASIKPEWRPTLRTIRSYVATLEATVGLHEPGT